jgi:hypothetical protein
MAAGEHGPPVFKLKNAVRFKFLFASSGYNLTCMLRAMREFAVTAVSLAGECEELSRSASVTQSQLGERLTDTLVVFGEDWGGHPSSTQHLMTHLSRDWRILWVDSLGLRRPRLTARDAGRAFSKGCARFTQRSNRYEEANAPFPVIAPLALPFPGSKIARGLNSQLLARRLCPILEAETMRRPILWMSLPTAVAAAGRLGERAIVYYCGDDFGALEGVDHEAVARLENELAFRADLVIAASASLAARFPSRKTIHVPHGVDFDLFSKPAPRAPDLPEGRPVAGYYGSIAGWVDLDAVAAAARQLPHWDFIFIGPVKTDIRPAAKLRNIKFLGPRPHAALPSYAQHWTVSLIPFRDNAQIQACNPLKLREYLAAGRPIASATSFPALTPYAPYVTVASAPADYAQAILKASRSPLDRSQLRHTVESESWAARAREIHRALVRL